MGFPEQIARNVLRYLRELLGGPESRLPETPETSAENDTEAPPQPAPETSSEALGFEHSPDYTTVNWQMQELHLSPMQSQVVRLLHEEFRNGRGELEDTFLLREIKSKSKILGGVFRRSPAWDNLIVQGDQKGTHRLNFPR